jgi:hypothetical protein
MQSLNITFNLVTVADFGGLKLGWCKLITGIVGYKHERCQRQKWLMWSVLGIFLGERDEADFASDCNFPPF